MKFIFPASLILAFSFARLETKIRVPFLILIILSNFHGYKNYKVDNKIYSSWASIDASNRKLASHILEKANVGCAVFSSNLKVRGYANLLFQRGIYEGKSYLEASELLAKRNACASVYLLGTLVFPDLPKYTTAIVTHDGNSMVEINDDGIVRHFEASEAIYHILSLPDGNWIIDHIFFLTDNSWVDGIARRWAGFFVPNTPKFYDEYKLGRFVQLANRETREITRIEPNGLYLNIYLNGDPLDSEKVGLPTRFIVIDKASHNPEEVKK